MESEAEARICQSCKATFTITAEDFGFYAKLKVPPPTWCPECRLIRRFSWRNEHNLFRRTESKDGGTVFSSYSTNRPKVIYDTKTWWSDSWDASDYGVDYDFKRPFFEQIRELADRVPWPARSIVNSVNSDYSNNAKDLRNCYLCFDATALENCSYVIGGLATKESLDLYQTRHAELCYECYMVDESYKVFFSVNCEDSTDIWFSRNLVGCTNCFGCVNLRNKSYYIFNKPATREGYLEFMKSLNFGSYAVIKEMREKAHAFWERHPMRFTMGINNVDSTGEHIEHSKNVHESFMIHEGENLKYCAMLGGPVGDSYDYVVWGAKAYLIYESLGVGDESERVRFSVNCFTGDSDIEYSIYSLSSSSLFGCVGMRKKQYCILNKQYSKEDYFTLREKIIEHMNVMPYVDSAGRIYRYGEFFPPEFSPSAYNETIAQDFFPKSRDQAEAAGYWWHDGERREFPITLANEQIPDSIRDVQDSILSESIGCSECHRAFKVVEAELGFYRRIGIPLPRKCPDCRFKDRFQFVNPPKFWKGKCHCAGAADDRGIYTNGTKHIHAEEHCPNEFETSYAPEKPDIIYCEPCYQAEVA